jgi:hypothetical protein
MKRRIPRLRTDEEAEAFLDSDLSDLDFSEFKSGRLRFERTSVIDEQGAKKLPAATPGKTRLPAPRKRRAR